MFWFRRRRFSCRSVGGMRRFNPVATTAVVFFVFTCYVCLLTSMFNVNDVVEGGDDENAAFDHKIASSSPVILSINQYENGFYLNRDQWLLSQRRQNGVRTRAGSDGRDVDARLRHLMANPPRHPDVDGGGNGIGTPGFTQPVQPKSVPVNNDDERVVVVDDINSSDKNNKSTNTVVDINCNTMHEITHREFLASGWTKAVYGGKFRGIPVAVKTVNTNGHDIELCLTQTGASMKECYRKSSAKILKEIVLLKELVHDNMLKVLGYCIPNRDFAGDDSSIVAMVAELGEPMDIIRLLQMSWEDRLRISLGIARLLYHLAHSPLGSLAMNDFRRQQFVLTNGEVKLSDVDDIGLDEPMCNTSCLLHIPAANTSMNIDCIHGYCPGYNEKQNIIKAGRHFTTFLLPHGAPKSLRPLVNDIVSAYNSASWNTQQLLDSTTKLVHLYTSGQYLQRDAKVKTKEYYKFLESDLPGAFDYRCQLSLSGNGCTLSVFDAEEAEDICRDDPDCHAFVMTQQTTWTGRHLVHFKNNVSRPSWNSDTVLYVKIPDQR